MVAEAWILRMGTQMSSSNMKHARKSTKKEGPHEKQILGILSFEVAKVMSKILSLHRSLTDHEMLKLKNEILKSEGINALVPCDETQLLELALFEKLDDLSRIATVVSRLGKKCSFPALQGFEYVFGDIVSGNIDVKQLGFLVKDMEAMARKMEKYVSQVVGLYSEMEVMAELELAAKKFHQNPHEESQKVLKQKLLRQNHYVNRLKDMSLWHLTCDKVVPLLAQTVCTVYYRMHTVFADGLRLQISDRFDVADNSGNGYTSSYSGRIGNKGLERRTTRIQGQKTKEDLFGPQDFNFTCFTECLRLSSSSASKVNDDNVEESNSFACGNNKARPLILGSAETVGGSALGLHYANVIIIIEKLVRYPHLVGKEARDELYEMLPMSLRKRVKAKLKGDVRNVAIFDGDVADDWKERVEVVLGWMGPLAHNMIKWQTDRSLEQHQVVASTSTSTSTNVLLIQTLYYAGVEETESSICEMLVGLNYICRYEQQQNALEDWTAWGS